MTSADYLQLLDWTARQIVGGNRGSTPADAPPIFARLRIKPEVWCQLIANFGILFSLVAGQPHHVDQFRSRRRRTRVLLSPGPLRSKVECPRVLFAWSPNGKYLAAGSDHKLTVIWDVDSALAIRTLRDAAQISIVDWNPDSLRLATAAEDGTVSIWDASTGERQSLLMLTAGLVRSLDWHPDGNLLLACGGRTGAVELKVWNTATATEDSRWKYSSAHSASFSPDGKRLFYRHAPVTVADFATHEVASSFAEIGAYNSSWSADGRLLASAINGGVIRIWDAETGVITGSIQRSHPQGDPVVWSPVGSLLASSSNGMVKVWDAAALDNNPAKLSTPGKFPVSTAFSPDWRHLIARAKSGSYKLWDVQSGEVVYSLQSDLSWHSAVTFSPDGKHFAVKGPVDRGGSVVICDTDTGELLLELPESKDPVTSLAFSPDGKVLAVYYVTTLFKVLNGRVELFDTHSGRSVATSKNAKVTNLALAWNHDGSRLAATGDAIRIFDPSLHELATPAVESGCLDWSPDGRQLATSGIGGKITIYDTTAWTPIHIVDGHQTFVNAISWHPHMPRIASGSRDGTTRIFDTLAGRELCILDAHEVSATDAASLGVLMGCAWPQQARMRSSEFGMDPWRTLI